MNNISFSEIDLTGVLGVLIDIDNTLYGYSFPHHQALTACYAAFSHVSVSVSREDFFTRYRACRDAVTLRLTPQGACRSRLLAFQLLFEEWAFPRAYALALTYDRLYWETFIGAMRLDPEAEVFLDRLKRAKIPVCAVSDMLASIQIEKLEALGVTDRLGFLVTSEEVGAEKPSPKMFQAGLEKLGISPNEAVMIGDDPHKDVAGAQALGIRAFTIRLGEAV